MFQRCLFILGCLILSAMAALAAKAQTASQQIPPPDEQNETMRDTLRRMQIRREEDEHKKLLSKGFQIKKDADSLADEAVNDRLPRASEKRLKEIEKAARQIRSDFGGSQDDELESPPKTLADALKRLKETGTQLNDRLAKTSRQVISIPVVESCTDIIQLVRVLRTYLN